MRDAFIDRLYTEAQLDPSVMLVVGDLGFGVVERFQTDMPDQFLNAGVAEQAMIGICAGLAARGHRVFAYSIANFPTMRCLEQIRLDVCYHDLDVTVVSVGAGTAYGSLGYSHHAVEDLAVMRCLPGMTVMSPADPFEAQALTSLALRIPGPKYLRLGKAGERRLHPGEPRIEIGKPLLLRNGKDVAILATGSVVGLGLEAAELLRRQGVDARVLSFPTLKPLDTSSLVDALTGVAAFVTVEEHSRIGGLRSTILESLQGTGIVMPSASVAWPDKVIHAMGSSDYLRNLVGMTSPALGEKAMSILSERPQSSAGVDHEH